MTNLLARLFVAGITLFSCLGETVAKDVHVRGYTRKDGNEVRPHYRSAPDGNFSNNWSTLGNVNPYTNEIGTKTRPSPSPYGRTHFDSVHPPLVTSVPPETTTPELSTGSQSQAIELENARLAIEAQARQRREAEALFRLASERRIAAESALRKIEFEKIEARTLAEARLKMTEDARRLEEKWSIDETKRRQQDLDYANAQLAALLNAQEKAETMAVLGEHQRAATTEAAIAAAHRKASAKFFGDGRQEQRDLRRKRADDFARAQRAVQVRTGAQSRESTRQLAIAQSRYEWTTTIADRKEARESSWLAEKKRWRTETEQSIASAADWRRREWELKEQYLIADAKSKLEGQIAQGAYAFASAAPEAGEQAEPRTESSARGLATSQDKVTDHSTPTGAVSLGAIITVLASAAATLLLRL